MGLVDRILDASVVSSFDRSGFARHVGDPEAGPWRDVSGSRALVTGGTAGIGEAVALALRERGASVDVWGRSTARLEAAAEAGLTPVRCDLGEPEQVDEALDACCAAGPAFDLIVLNAGGMPLELTRNSLGEELIWASQVLGHAQLVHGLARRGMLADGARVVLVSSGGQYLAALDLADVEVRRGTYRRHAVYARAKRAQVVLAKIWQRELGPQVPGLRIAAMHPGWVDTAAVATSMPVFHRVTRGILRTPEQGADTITWLCAVDRSWPGGGFWFDRREVPDRSPVSPADPPGAAEELWRRVRARGLPR